jgi:hypothetical protein
MQLESPPKTGDSNLDIWLEKLAEGLKFINLHEGLKLNLSGTELHLSGTGDQISPSLYNCMLQVRKNAGKSELIAIFPTGTEQRIAIEP